MSDRPRAAGVLLDIDGVLTVSWRPVTGAPAAVQALRGAGLPLRFVTNTTSRSATEIAERLRAAGVEVDDDELVTAGVATAAHLRRHHPGARCLVLNDGSMEDLAGVERAEAHDTTADVVVIGSAGPSFGWEQLNVALRCLEAGAALVAMHGSRVWRTDAGDCLDGGAYARLLEVAAGVDAVVVGKPAPALFRAALDSMGVAPRDAVMVGDDLVSDVLAAQALGVRGVLVRTGKFRPQVLHGDTGRPDAVLDSVADLAAYLGVG